MEKWGDVELPLTGRVSFSHSDGPVENGHRIWKVTVVGGTKLFHWIMMMGGRVLSSAAFKEDIACEFSCRFEAAGLIWKDLEYPKMC